MVAIEKYGPRSRSIGCAPSEKTPAAIPPRSHASGAGVGFSCSMSRAATNPPMPKNAACPKLTCPR